jgi:integrase
MIARKGSKYTARAWNAQTKKMVYLGSFDTEVEAKRAEARETLRPTRDRPVTVAEWAAMWLSDYARDAAATRANYRYATNAITARMGSMQLADIDRPLARKLAAEWPVNTTRAARTMFGDAMRDGLIDFNPFSQLRLETPRGRKDIDALTPTQIVELSEIAEATYGLGYGAEAAAIILTLGFAGMRPGELCSLRQADVDLDAGRALIRWNTGADRVEKLPKNGKPREIVLLEPVCDALRRLPPRIGPDARVFLTYREKAFYKGTLAYFWRPISTTWKATHPAVTLYHLRHACATLLIEAGHSPADVAIQLGHQDGGRLVQTVYGHPDHGRALDRISMTSPVAKPEDAPERARRSA